MEQISGETQIIGFFGATYRTSKMYAMYNAAFQALKLNYIYVPLAVQDLAKAVDGVRHLGIKAIGVTIPYKVEVIPYLDDLDQDARRIGAVNAILNQDGRLLGANTDGKGAVRALLEVSADWYVEFSSRATKEMSVCRSFAEVVHPLWPSNTPQNIQSLLDWPCSVAATDCGTSMIFSAWSSSMGSLLGICTTS